MNGVALFIFTPDRENKKEFMINKLERALQAYDIETKKLNLYLPDSNQQLQKINQYFCSIPFTKKHFIFSFDGDGFDVGTKMDGLFVDQVQYNIFSYLTNHPRFFFNKIAGINSWYISVLNCVRNGVSYMEEKFPHLDGTEFMAAPFFSDTPSEQNITERTFDLLFLADAGEEGKYLLDFLTQTSLKTIVYGFGWDTFYTGNFQENITILPESELKYDKKLNYMGQSKLTLFLHNNMDHGIDIDVLSAAANGSCIYTEETEELKSVFSSDEIGLYRKESIQNLCEQITDLLKKPETMQKQAHSGKKKAEQIGDMSRFIENLLKACK